MYIAHFKRMPFAAFKAAITEIAPKGTLLHMRYIGTDTMEILISRKYYAFLSSHLAKMGMTIMHDYDPAAIAIRRGSGTVRDHQEANAFQANEAWTRASCNATKPECALFYRRRVDAHAALWPSVFKTAKSAQLTEFFAEAYKKQVEARAQRQPLDESPDSSGNGDTVSAWGPDVAAVSAWGPDVAADHSRACNTSSGRRWCTSDRRW